MSVTSSENAPGFLNNKIIVYLANIKTDIGCIRGFPGILVRGKANQGDDWKSSRNGPVESRSGVYGEKTNPQNPPRERLQLFAERKTTTLATFKKSSLLELLIFSRCVGLDDISDRKRRCRIAGLCDF